MSDRQNDHWQELQVLAQEIMTKKEVPGVAFGLLYDGEVSTTGIGVTNIEQPLPVSGKTLFQIGSITKTFTGTLVMRLVEEGKLNLDTPILNYLPEFKVQDEHTTQTVTTRHLLTHTAGWAGDYFLNTGEGQDALTKYMLAMAELPQISPLGVHFSYNNAGFYLAGHLVEQITGQTYENVLRETLLAPLDLEQAYLYASDVLTHNFAVGHLNDPDGPKVARPWAMPRAGQPVGGLITNVETLLRYAKFQMGDGSVHSQDSNIKHILSAETISAMREPLVKIRESEHWGLSWKIWEVNGERLINHGGGTLGQITNLIIAPKHNFAFAVLTNADRGSFMTTGLTRLALKRYLEIDLPQPKPIESSPEDLAGFAGKFKRPWAEIELGVLSGRLIGQFIHKGGFPDKDSPPPSSPHPMTLAPYGPDRLLVMDGDSKDSIADLVRQEDGSTGWLRFGLRLHAYQT